MPRCDCFVDVGCGHAKGVSSVFVACSACSLCGVRLSERDGRLGMPKRSTCSRRMGCASVTRVRTVTLPPVFSFFSFSFPPNFFPFLFFSGPGRCGCGFCAWCLRDCGGDAHQHVGRCSAKPDAARADPFFASKALVDSAQRARRVERLRAHLASLDAETRDLLVRDMKAMLDDRLPGWAA
eukprot:698340-Rhodomonas_salina.2